MLIKLKNTRYNVLIELKQRLYAYTTKIAGFEYKCIAYELDNSIIELCFEKEELSDI